MKNKSLLLTIAILIFAMSSLAQVTGSFTDTRDGKVYKTVKIGDQIWMAENLKYETTGGSWCYENNPSNCSKYGVMYDWETAKKVAPAGWRLPSDGDWMLFLMVTGGAISDLQGGGSTGFNALYGGTRSSTGDFHFSRVCFWSSSEDDDGALHLEMLFDDDRAYMQSDDAGDGYYVRLVKD
jgi:uncharacterized protein (TIGR02145 family)